MNGLRIFVKPDSRSGENSVFYSQRSHGPIYRWHYEEFLDRWHVVRVHALASSSKELCAARSEPWRTGMPTGCAQFLDRWHVVRVHALASSSKELCAARWHSVPPGLRAQLSEHY